MAELTASCCSTEMQASCCEPGAKASCCEVPARAEGSCGCSAGQGEAPREDATRPGPAAS